MKTEFAGEEHAWVEELSLKKVYKSVERDCMASLSSFEFQIPEGASDEEAAKLICAVHLLFRLYFD